MWTRVGFGIALTGTSGLGTAFELDWTVGVSVWPYKGNRTRVEVFRRVCRDGKPDRAQAWGFNLPRLWKRKRQ